jgi:hypothetical protein
LNTEEILNSEKTNISLKKHLNEFMGNKLNNTELKIEEFRNDFTETLSMIDSQFGDVAFYNVQTSDLTTIRRRFYPTIFDSVMIATSIAIKNGICIRTGSVQ